MAAARPTFRIFFEIVPFHNAPGAPKKRWLESFGTQRTGHCDRLPVTVRRLRSFVMLQDKLPEPA
jgi:hypothetical protein